MRKCKRSGSSDTVDNGVSELEQPLNHTPLTKLETLRKVRADKSDPLAAAAKAKAGPLVQFFEQARNWALFYAILFGLSLLFCTSARTVVTLMKSISSMICFCLISPLGILRALQEVCFHAVFQRNSSSKRKPSQTKSNIKWGLVYGFFLSLSLRSFTASNGYTRIFHSLKPCHKIDAIMHDLRYAETMPKNLSYDEKLRSMQALGLDNAYLRQYSLALKVHLDRYGRNETKGQQFLFVKTINLIGNVFDDEGAAYLLNVLAEHPHAYTTTLLLGRNRDLGDKTAHRLASLIEKGKTSPLLTSLSMEATGVTSKGLAALYSAMGTKRPFLYLGVGYTDKYFWERFLPWNLLASNNNPVADSIPFLHKAKALQELGLDANKLSDGSMKALAFNLKETSITSLCLVNNWIGPQGVHDLLPLLANNQLKELDLGINAGIGNDGAIMLANALMTNDTHASKLEHLSLFNSGVGQTGADALLDIFPGNTKLRHLQLRTVGPHLRSSIREETLVALQKAVESNWPTIHQELY